MDRREAIQELASLAWVQGNANRDKAIEALDLAIEALVLRDKYIKAVERMIEGAKEINRFLEEASKKSDEKHQLSGETSTCKLKKDHVFLIREGEKVSKEQKSKLDCISRQDAIEAVANHFMADAWIRNPSASNDIEDWKKIAESVLSKIPPVTPTERTGEWIRKGGSFQCPVCGEIWNFFNDTRKKFCPNCGARMVGGEHEID